MGVQSSTELPNVETPPSAAEKEKDQQAEELEEECTVATIAAVADCEAVWKKCVTVVKTADCWGHQVHGVGLPENPHEGRAPM